MDLETVKAWIWPAIFVLTGVVAGVAVNRLLLDRLREAAARTRMGWDDVVLDSLGRSPVLWFAALGVYAALESLALRGAIRETLQTTLVVLVIFSVTLVASRAAAEGVRLVSRRSAGGVPSSSLITNITRILVFVLGGLVILRQMGIEITPLITGLGIGGLAVALALQDTLSNLFSGFQIILTRQVVSGDYIRLENGEEGYVTDVQWRNTTIKSRLDDSETVIPNRKLADAVLTNFSLPRQPLWVRVEVGVSYDSDLERVEEVTLEVAREVAREYADAPDEVEPVVRYRSFGDSSIQFAVRIYVGDYDRQFRVKHEFIKRLHRRYAEEGIEIPFPQRVLGFSQPLETEGFAPPPDAGRGERLA